MKRKKQTNTLQHNVVSNYMKSSKRSHHTYKDGKAKFYSNISLIFLGTKLPSSVPLISAGENLSSWISIHHQAAQLLDQPPCHNESQLRTSTLHPTKRLWWHCINSMKRVEIAAKIFTQRYITSTHMTPPTVQKERQQISSWHLASAHTYSNWTPFNIILAPPQQLACAKSPDSGVEKSSG